MAVMPLLLAANLKILRTIIAALGHQNGRIEVKIFHKIFPSKCCTSILHG